MQQQVDFLLFLLSYGVLIYWGVLVFKYKGNNTTLLLRLSGKQIVGLLIAELILFVAMYSNYSFNQSPEIADSFAWHYSIVYARGVMPLAGLAAINDKVFGLKDPVLVCLITALVVDYIFLLLLSRIAVVLKKKKHL